MLPRPVVPLRLLVRQPSSFHSFFPFFVAQVVVVATAVVATTDLVVVVVTAAVDLSSFVSSSLRPDHLQVAAFVAVADTVVAAYQLVAPNSLQLRLVFLSYL